MTTESAVPPDTNAYARFTRRVQGVCIDAIVFMFIFAGALIIAVSFGSDNIARVLGFTVAASWLLYEPVLVSMTGGTVGHRLYNMRVVDDRSGGNISFGKAVVRMVIKTVLGWYSFIAMAVTSRHQALHDLATGSTVQMRNLAQARPHHFSTRQDLSGSGMPSLGRRLLLIVAYELGWFLVCWFALVALFTFGQISAACIDNDVCRAGENLWIDAVGLAWIGVSALIVFLGWRGRLWGGRVRRQPV
jgi:uncharacterized RDD family membrane protein YckC